MATADPPAPTDGDGSPRRRVVVGVDGSTGSRWALRRAAEEADAHDAVLEVVMAWSLLDQPTRATFDPHGTPATAEADLRRIVEEVLGTERAADCELRVETDLPARALL